MPPPTASWRHAATPLLYHVILKHAYKNKQQPKSSCNHIRRTRIMFFHTSCGQSSTDHRQTSFTSAYRTPQQHCQQGTLSRFTKSSIVITFPQTYEPAVISILSRESALNLVPPKRHFLHANWSAPPTYASDFSQ